MDINGITQAYGRTHEPIPPYKSFCDPRSIKLGSDSSFLLRVGKFIHTVNEYDKNPELPKRGEIFLRPEVIKRLIDVQSKLPNGFSLHIYDGYRTRDFQEKLVEYFAVAIPDVEAKYISNPSDSLLVPPHITGGAIDLTLAYKGKALELGTAYDSFEEASHIDFLESTDDRDSEVSQLRRMFYHSMIAEGFAPHPNAWWHWSYGDQWWAAFYGESESIYSELI